MNGQFAGSNFRADVFAPDMEAQDGYFCNSFPQITKNYGVHFHPYEGRSRQLYDHLTERLDKIKYIAVCTGTEALNEEIAEDLRDFLSQKGKQIPVYQCSNRGIQITDGSTGETTAHRIYHPDVLSTKKLDQMAMTVNRYYMGSYSKGALNDWLECDYFSRQSCRAATDFIPAVLRAAGKSAQQAAKGDWALSAQQLENLSKTEHLRWCAFHYCMGFSPMDDAEFAERAELYRQGTPIRIGKNMFGKTHACLVPWDALDELSAKENAITGKNVDYKAMDTDNIMAIPQLLQSTEE
jgi:hypothetical protein